MRIILKKRGIEMNSSHKRDVQSNNNIYGKIMKEFTTTVCVKQGCVTSQILFSVVWNETIKEVTKCMKKRN